MKLEAADPIGQSNIILYLLYLGLLLRIFRQTDRQTHHRVWIVMFIYINILFLVHFLRSFSERNCLKEAMIPRQRYGGINAIVYESERERQAGLATILHVHGA
jgi:hypothetical protein